MTGVKYFPIAPAVWMSRRTIEASNKEEPGMSWARFDDNYSLNPKILAAGPWPELLDMRAIIWCARYETDGYVAPDALVVIGLGIPQVRQKIRRLLDVGRWEKCDEGWTIVHYLKYNPSRADQEKRRSEGRERAARSRERNAKQDRTYAVGSGDPRGGDGEVSSFLDGFAITDCEICDKVGLVLNEQGEAEKCSHGQEQSNVTHLRSSSVAESETA